MQSRILKTALALGVLTLVVGAGNPNPKVLPPVASPNGLTYGQWGAEWWKWVYAQPAAANPIQDPTGAFGQVSQPGGPVWFLAGTFGEVVIRSNTVPVGKAIFFPLINVFNDYPCPDPNFHPAPGQSLEDFLAEGASAFIAPTTNLVCEVDGVSLKGLFSYRGTSGLVTFTGDPSWTVLDPCITGEVQYGVADGYWLMLAPMPKGQHTVRFGAAGSNGFSLDVTYHLTIQ